MKRILSIPLTLCMLVALLPAYALAAGSDPFTDVASDAWYSDEVLWAYDEGLMGGVGNDMFDPEGTVTRCMVWTVLARHDGVDTSESDPWYKVGQDWAMENEISDGTSYCTDVTREQLATMLYRYAQYKGADTTQGGMAIREFSDFDSISEYAVEALAWAVNIGITNGMGDNTLAPQGTATRAQFAAMLYRFCAAVEEEETTTPTTPVYTHYHSYGNWAANEDGTHTRTCSCGASETANCTYSGEACTVCGYKDGNLHITTVDQLKAVADAVNAGETYEGVTIILENDIALSDNWTSIGNGERDGKTYTGNAFKGTFDGNGKTIINVNNCLFGIVDGGTVKNVSLVAAIDSDADSVGAAVAVLCGGGTVDGVNVSGTVTGYKGVGGVVGRILVEGTVTNCTNSAAVIQTGDNDSAGGIVGKAYYTEAGKEMTISNCTNNGTVNSDYAAGGIVGFSAANVTGCTNTAVITSGFEAGGIVGEQTNYGDVSGNTNTANITAVGKSGGIIGWIRYQTSADNYANNEVITVTGNTNSGIISATGDISAQSSAGGIVGLAYKQAVVTGNSNTAASITAGTFAAGIVGAIQEGDGKDVGDGKFVVSNNATTTTIENISANCIDLIVYNNEPNNSDFATIEGNGEKFVAKIGETPYTTLSEAIEAVTDSTAVEIVILETGDTA